MLKNYSLKYIKIFILKIILKYIVNRKRLGNTGYASTENKYLCVDWLFPFYLELIALVTIILMIPSGRCDKFIRKFEMFKIVYVLTQELSVQQSCLRRASLVRYAHGFDINRHECAAFVPSCDYSIDNHWRPDKVVAS